MRFSSRYWICSSLLFVIGVTPLFAQGQVRLRLAHGGSFLPAETQIIVIDKPGDPDENGRFQPEFIANNNYPIALSSIVQRDQLDRSGSSLLSYPQTRQEGRLYFIYALTPDSALYWSYSARMQQPKYDVVNKGVMSVAPIISPEAQVIIHEVFFTPPSATSRLATSQVAAPESSVSPLSSDSLAKASALLPSPTETATTPERPVTASGIPFWIQITLPLLLGGIIVILLVRINQLKAELRERKEALNQTRQQIHLYANLPGKPKPERPEASAKEEPEPVQVTQEPTTLAAALELEPIEAEVHDLDHLGHPEETTTELTEEKEQEDFPLIPPPPISEEVIRAQREKKNQPPPEIVIIPDEELGHPEMSSDTLILDEAILQETPSDIPLISQDVQQDEEAPTPLDADSEEAQDHSELMSRYQALMRDLDLYRSSPEGVEGITDPATQETTEDKG